MTRLVGTRYFYNLSDNTNFVIKDDWVLTTRYVFYVADCN